MKNLFKNLMLVAVAAMAFTACTETNDEVNAVSKKTVLNGVVGFAEETRSGFSEETSTNDEGKTVYHSEWDGNESILVVCNGQAKTAPITKNDEGNANFTVEFDGELGDLYYVSVYSPASAFDQSGICTIPSEQTPRANSVDPAAHALSVSSTPVSAGSAYFAMQHSAAYGKMTVKGVEFAIDHVVVDLKGSYSGYDRELSYTINADNVENNTFWFATEPIVVAEFTVTAYDAEGNSAAKTVDVAADPDKSLAFDRGRVSTFSVSGLEEPEVTYDSTYAYIYEGGVEYNDVSYMFVADDNRGLRIDFCGIIVDGAIPAGTYTFSTSYGMYPNWSYYYPNVDGWDSTKLKYGQAVVSVKDGQYMIVFTNLADANANVVVEQFTFKGELPGLVAPDPRVKLATPEVTYTNEDKVVTLTWGADANAESFLVTCDNESIDDVTTTDTSVTITLPEYGAYNFSVTAKVADNNENYKSSDAANIMVVVKDPNAWADYELTSVAVSGTYVTMTDANDNRVTFFMNAADRIGNGIKLGDYTFVNSETPAVGQFVTYIVAYDGTWKYAYQIGSGSMSVEEVNGEYKILITVDGIRFGYVGTEALGAPITGPTIIASTDTLSFVQAGGSKTIDLTIANLTEDITVTSTNNHFTATVSGNVLTVDAPENTVEAAQEATITLSANGATATITVTQEAYNPNAAVEDGSEANPYSIKSAFTSGWEIHFADASNGDSFQMDVTNTDMRDWINDHGADTWIKFSALLYSSGANLYTHNGSVYYIESYAGYSYIKLSRDASTKVYTCDFKMSVDGGNTYTYYRYVGTIDGQQ